MTKFLTAAALLVTLSVGAIGATSTPADANPTSGFSISGQSNPFDSSRGR